MCLERSRGNALDINYFKASVCGMLLQRPETGPPEFTSSVPGSILGKVNRESRAERNSGACCGPLRIPL